MMSYQGNTVKKLKSKRLQRLAEVIRKHPFTLPTDGTDIPFCLLDKLISQYVENHLVPSHRVFCSTLLQIITRDLYHAGYRVVEETVSMDDMVVFKQTAKKSEVKRPWISDIFVNKTNG